MRAGEIVQVLSFREIAETLDERGELEGVPFMPEMLAYCGRPFEAWKRAHKTCDEGAGGVIRHVQRAVHLKELRCSGEAHGGCDCGCLFFWKEQWLKRASEEDEDDFAGTKFWPSAAEADRERATLERIRRATRAANSAKNGEELFSCQATEIARFSQPLPWWDARQYVRDLRAGNVTVGEFLLGISVGLISKIRNWFGRWGFGEVCGVNTQTPKDNLNLLPGDLVQIKPKDEIVATLDHHGKNRGLSFRPAMAPYCGKQFRVVRRVAKIIDPQSRRLRSLGEGSVILDGVVCTGSTRRFCPRMVYTYWRDIWLRKVTCGEPATDVQPVAEPVTAAVEALWVAQPAQRTARQTDPPSPATS